MFRLSNSLFLLPFLLSLLLLLPYTSACTCTFPVTSPSPSSFSNSALQLVSLSFSFLSDLPDVSHNLALVTASMFEVHQIYVHRPQLTTLSIQIPKQLSLNQAVAYAAYASMYQILRLHPSKRAQLDNEIMKLGFPDTSIRDTFGLHIARAIEKKFPLNLPLPVYNPPNKPSTTEDADCDLIHDPDAWQPLCTGAIPEENKMCRIQSVPFLSQFNASLISANGEQDVERLIAGIPSPYEFEGNLTDVMKSSSKFARQFREVLNVYERLNDRRKMIAEVFRPNGAIAVHAIGINELQVRDIGLKQSIIILFTLSTAVRDGFIGSTTIKLRYSTARPLSILQCGYKGKNIRSWKGDYQGVGDFMNDINSGILWRPYISTSLHPSYISGHSTFVASGMRVLTRYLGNEVKGMNCFVIKEGEGKREGRILKGEDGFIEGVTNVANSGIDRIGYVPAKDTEICWKSFSRYSTLASLSRLYGGIHTREEIIQGRRLGRMAANRAYKFVQSKL